jgi:hypothetical protein
MEDEIQPDSIMGLVYQTGFAALDKTMVGKVVSTKKVR